MHVQVHLGSDAVEALGQEMRRAHSCRQSTEGMLNRPAANTHAVGCLVYTGLHDIELFLMGPVADASIITE